MEPDEGTTTGGGANVGKDARAGRDFTGRDWRSDGDRRQEFHVDLGNLSRADLYLEIRKLSELLWETRSDIRVTKVESVRTHEGIERFVIAVNAELRSLRLITSIALGGVIVMAVLSTVLYLGYRWRVDGLDERITTIERALPTPTPWWVFPGGPVRPGSEP